jgi:hypothetical protein
MLATPKRQAPDMRIEGTGVAAEQIVPELRSLLVSLSGRAPAFFA